MLWKENEGKTDLFIKRVSETIPLIYTILQKNCSFNSNLPLLCFNSLAIFQRDNKLHHDPPNSFYFSLDFFYENKKCANGIMRIIVILPDHSKLLKSGILDKMLKLPKLYNKNDLNMIYDQLGAKPLLNDSLTSKNNILNLIHDDKISIFDFISNDTLYNTREWRNEYLKSWENEIWLFLIFSHNSAKFQVKQRMMKYYINKVRKQLK